MAKEVLGHIDCPSCGTAKGMRITQDRNGDPFGYCEATCSQQLRVGGDADRVRRFLARFPWAAGKPAEASPAPVTGTAPAAAPAPVAKPAPKPAAKAAPKPAPVPAPAPAARPAFDPFAWMTK